MKLIKSAFFKSYYVLLKIVSIHVASLYDIIVLYKR